MADLESIGKLINLRVAWLAASLVLWAWVLVRLVTTGRAPIPRAPRQLVSWPGVPVCATFVAALLIPAFLLSLAQTLAPNLVGLFREPEGALALVQWNLAMRLVQIGVILRLLALSGPLRKEDFGCDLTNWREDLATGVKGFLASAAPVLGILWIVSVLEWRTGNDKHHLLQVVESGPGFALLAWITVSVVIVAPLSEELVYRVLLQGWLQTQIPAWQAVLITAGVFTVAHEEFDRLPLFPLALILGYVYCRRRSYLSVVVLHSLFNAVNLAQALIR